MRVWRIGAVALAAYGMMGSQCVNEDFLVAVNLDAMEMVIAIPAGTTTTWSGGATLTYLDYGNTDFGAPADVRIYDIIVQTTGTYAGGNVTGDATVNGIALLNFTGTWDSFNTAQSLLTSPSLTSNPAGVTALVNAVLAQQTLTLAGSGTATPSPIPSGLSVSIKILAQVDAEP